MVKHQGFCLQRGYSHKLNRCLQPQGFTAFHSFKYQLCSIFSILSDFQVCLERHPTALFEGVSALLPLPMSKFILVPFLLRLLTEILFSFPSKVEKRHTLQIYISLVKLGAAKI